MTRERFSLLFLVLLIAGAGLKEPRLFSPSSADSILLWIPLILTVAAGQLLVILTGGIDISVGSILGFSAICVGMLLRQSPDLPIWAALAAGGGIGLVLGAINAGLVVGGRLSPLMATIATLAAFRGLTHLISGGNQVDAADLPDSLGDLARHGLSLGAVTLTGLFLISASAAVLLATMLRRTRTGRDIYALGSNELAAYRRGIHPGRTRAIAFCLCGAMAGIAGVLYAARFGFVNPATAGQGFELTVIAAVAIGGAKLTGGAGSMVGVLLGSLILAVLNVSLSLLRIDANWQVLAYGLVILVAVLTSGFAREAG